MKNRLFKLSCLGILTGLPCSAFETGNKIADNSPDILPSIIMGAGLFAFLVGLLWLFTLLRRSWNHSIKSANR